ncbi:MAG: Hvo_1808 family surface protein [Halanaeroarchaeum sp.]
MRRPLGVLAVLIIVVTAGCGGAIPAPADSTTTNEDPTTAGEPTTVSPPDPETDVIGWEDGYWYNETLTVDQSDGLNETEREAVVSRAMARVEYVRGLEFDERVPVEVISRTEHRNRTNGSFSGVSTNDSLHQDVKFEATFLVGESDSATSQQEQNRASSVLGYYSPSEDEIVIVSENTESPRIDEVTLAQELFHALQEHRFEVSEYEANTEEMHNARAGIIEGDANYVDHLYEEEFGDSLVRDSSSDSDEGGGGDGSHVGMLALQLQPYSDGPVFVEQRYEEGGWEAVNAVYDAPPQSTEQTIHTEKYRSDEPTTVTVDDRSNENWTVPDLGNGSVDYAQFGEAGMYVMLWYPSYEASQEAGEVRNVAIPYADFFAPRDEPGIDQYNYDHRYSAGWDGDKLYPYVRNDSAETGETGYVWKSTWDSSEEAAEFQAGYRKVLDHYGAEPVEDRPNTYRIPDGDFADAFYVEQTGEDVVIVNAPTVEELSGVRAEAGTVAE